MCLYFPVHAEEYSTFKADLKKSIESLHASTKNNTPWAIYTQKALQNYSRLTENVELKVSGMHLLELLQDNNQTYNQLPFDLWLLASKDFLALDALLSQSSAWGNLAVKINICNKVLYSSLNWLENKRELLDDKKLRQLIVLQELLRLYITPNSSLGANSKYGV